MVQKRDKNEPEFQAVLHRNQSIRVFLEVPLAFLFLPIHHLFSFEFGGNFIFTSQFSLSTFDRTASIVHDLPVVVLQTWYKRLNKERRWIN